MHAADYTTPSPRVNVTELKGGHTDADRVPANEGRLAAVVRAVVANCSVTIGVVTNPPTYVLAKNETVALPHLYCGPIWVSAPAVVTEFLINSA